MLFVLKYQIDNYPCYKNAEYRNGKHLTDVFLFAGCFYADLALKLKNFHYPDTVSNVLVAKLIFI